MLDNLRGVLSMIFKGGFAVGLIGFFVGTGIGIAAGPLGAISGEVVFGGLGFVIGALSGAVLHLLLD